MGEWGISHKGRKDSAKAQIDLMMEMMELTRERSLPWRMFVPRGEGGVGVPFNKTESSAAVQISPQYSSLPSAASRQSVRAPS